MISLTINHIFGYLMQSMHDFMRSYTRISPVFGEKLSLRFRTITDCCAMTVTSFT